MQISDRGLETSDCGLVTEIGHWILGLRCWGWNFDLRFAIGDWD